ncbi:MAG: arsenical resistance protein ArsH, partial [Pseudoxanthomonas sp.]
AMAWQEFDQAGRMRPSAYYDRIVDVMEELVRFTLLTRPHVQALTDRYSERKESATAVVELASSASTA